ncbi:MAG: hypothetical protein AAFQ53_14810 [Bacteroidota bacterium]
MSGEREPEPLLTGFQAKMLLAIGVLIFLAKSCEEERHPNLSPQERDAWSDDMSDFDPR